MAEALVVVGKGMVATRFVDALAKRALGRYAVAVVGAEPRRAYNRVLLSSLLAGEVDEAAIELKPAKWWADMGVTALYGSSVTTIDRASKTVALADGRVLPYGKLVLATGSQPIRLPIPGADKPGVMTFRDIDDVETMREAAARGAKVVVVGGGLLGLEAAYGLTLRGAKVTVVHLMDRLMERQVDAEAGKLLADRIAAMGIEVLLEASTKEIFGKEHVEGVRLADGREIAADLVVLAAGVRPNVDIARAAGLNVNRGVVVDDGMTTEDPDVFAIGECIEHRGATYGLVEPGYAQAEALAARLAGRGSLYEGSVVATNLKVSGVAIFSAGDFMGLPGTQSIVLRDRALGLYKKLVVANDKLVGAVLVGDAADATWYLDLVKSGQSIASIRQDLVFGRALAERAVPRAA